MYSVEFTVKYRTSNPENKSGWSWKKQPSITIEAKTIEEVMDKAYSLPAPEDVDIEAISLKGNIWLLGGTRNRKTLSLDVFKEF